MKKWLGVLLLAGVAVWFYLHPETWRHAAGIFVPGMTQQKETLYRWRDEKGITHYTDDPPADGIEYQVVQLDPNAKITPSKNTE